jgi:hypothetical protein
LIESWLKANIFGYKLENDDIKSFYKPRKGVVQGSIIGPACCNVALNGLQKTLKEVFKKNERFEAEHSILQYGLKIHNKQEITELDDRTRKPYVKMEVIRFADDIIIVAKMSDQQISKVVSALKTFLRHRGMELKVPDNKNY